MNYKLRHKFYRKQGDLDDGKSTPSELISEKIESNNSSLLREFGKGVIHFVKHNFVVFLEQIKYLYFNSFDICQF